MTQQRTLARILLVSVFLYSLLGPVGIVFARERGDNRTATLPATRAQNEQDKRSESSGKPKLLITDPTKPVEKESQNYGQFDSAKNTLPEYKKTDEPEQNQLTKPESEPEVQNKFDTSSFTKPVDPALAKPPKDRIIAVDYSSGAATYSYPLNLPAGRNGLAPQLGLSYNNQRKNNENFFGYGWDMPMGRITRNKKYGVKNMYLNNKYVLELFGKNGELIKISENADSQIFGLRIEDQPFFKIEKYINKKGWQITDAKGIKYFFGENDASLHTDPDDSNRIFGWYLEKIEDNNGNNIQFHYAKTEGQIYSDFIEYAEFKIQFNYQGREDVYSNYSGGFGVQTIWRTKEVQILAENILRKKYKFTYSVGSNGARSLLKEIQETGYLAGGVEMSKPPVKFEYQKSDVAFTNVTDSYQLPGWTAFNQYFASTTQLTDVNGDGYNEFVSVGGGTKQVYINDQNGGWYPSEDWIFPFGITEGKFVDVDGDGKDDFWRAVSTGPMWYNGYSELCQNLGNGWGVSGKIGGGCGMSPFNQNNVFNLYGPIADIDGDGRVDIWNSYYNQPYNQTFTSEVYKNVGYNWFVKDDFWKFPVTFWGSEGQDNGARVSDMNGDGLSDLLFAPSVGTNFPELTGTLLNNGKGGFNKTSWQIPLGVLGPQPGGGDTVLITNIGDFNGDGLTDTAIAYPVNSIYPSYALNLTKIYINKGNGQYTETPYDILPYKMSYRGMVGDINDDGLPDFIQNDCWKYDGYGNINSDSTIIDSNTKCDKKIYLNTAKPADLLTKIVQPEGGQIEMTYKLEHGMVNIQTISKIKSSDQFGVTAETNYKYEDAYLNGTSDGFVGFGKMTETDPFGNKTIRYFHQGGGFDGKNLGEFEDNGFKRSLIYREEFSDNAGAKLRQTVYTWKSEFKESLVNNERSFVWLSDEVSTEYINGGSAKSKAASYTYDSENGNLLKETDWGEVSTDGVVMSTDKGEDKKIASYEYAKKDGKNTNYISEVIKKDFSGNKYSHARFYYDSQNLYEVLKGNQTKEEYWLDTKNAFIGTVKEYNDLGLVTSITDALGNTTVIEYDDVNLYPSKITNPKGHTEQFSYDIFNGNLLEQINSNGIKTARTFDPMGRVKTVKKADQLTGEFSYNDDVLPVSVTQISYAGSNLSRTEKNYFDGFKRVMQKRVSAEEENQFSVAGLSYNERGELIAQTLPQFETGINFSGFNNSVPKNSFEYDALGRIASLETPAGITETSYGLWQKTVTDGLDHKKIFAFDARGQLIDANGFVYKYDAAGNLLKITDAAGNIRNFTYDSLGRRLLTEDLHKPDDATFGVITYEYDDLGNLTKQTNPDGKFIPYTYDKLNRPLTEDSTTFAYDTAALGKGFLSSATKDKVKTSYEYDSFGNVVKETREIDGENFATAMQYDLLGRIKSLTAPNGVITNYTYGKDGLKKMEIVKNGATVLIINSKTFNAAGQTVSVKLSNGVESAYSYDDANRLISKTTKNGAKFLQNLSYEYDSVGNITKTTETADTLLKKEAVYTYDELDRLISAAINGKTYSYSYDIIGNILTKPFNGVAANYKYEETGYANPHAVTKITNAGADQIFTYDKQGNLIQDSSRVLTWNSKNELQKVAIAGNETQFLYDHTGNRVMKFGGQMSVKYINQAYEIEINGTDKTIRNYLYDGNELAATLEEKWVPQPAPPPVTVQQNLLNEVFSNAADVKNKWKIGSGLWSVAASNEYRQDSLDALARSYTSLSQNLVGSSTINYSYKQNLLNTSPENLGIGGKGVGFYFLVKDATKRHGLESYLLFQDKANLRLYKVTPNATGKVGVAVEKASFAAAKGTAKVFNYSVTYSSKTGVIEIKRDGVYIGSYTDPSPIQSGTAVMLMTNKMRARFDDISVTLYKEEFPPAPPPVAVPTLYHTHTDHLGGSSLVTGGLSVYSASFGITTAYTGTILQQLDEYPFGEERVNGKTAGSSFDTKKKFTGKELDPETGLYYYGARYYDATIGRFVSEDPSFLTLSDSRSFTTPQGWNSYSYALNNPVRYTDPDGRYAETAWDIMNVVYDFGKAAKNLGEAAYYGTSYIYHDLSGDYEKAAVAAEKNEENLKELGESAVDFGADVMATAIPFVPAGMTKADDAVKAANKTIKRITNANFQLSKIDKFFVKAEKNAEKFSVKKIGDFIQGSYEVAGKARGQARAIYYKAVDSAGKTIKVYKDSFNKFGDFVHRKIKLPKL